MYENKTIERLIEILKMKDLTPAILKNTLICLENLSQIKEYRNVITYNDGLERLLELVENQSLPVEEKTSVFYILCNLTNDVKTVKSMIENDIVNLLIKVMKNEPEMEIKECAGLTFLCLFQNDDQFISESGDYRDIIESLFTVIDFIQHKKLKFFSKDPTKIVPFVKQNKSVSTKIFKRSLHEIMERPTEKGDIPSIIDLIMGYLENYGIETEFVFQEEGDKEEIEKICTIIDYGGIPDLRLDINDKIHTLCGVITYFISSLPQPLLTYNAFDSFLEIVEITDLKKQKEELRENIDCLPDHNKRLLKRLMGLFYKISENKSQTKMTSHMIAVNFGLNLLRTNRDTIKLATSVDSIHKLCHLMIKYYKDIFVNVTNKDIEYKSKRKKTQIQKQQLQIQKEYLTEHHIQSEFNMTKTSILSDFYTSEKHFINTIKGILDVVETPIIQDYFNLIYEIHRKYFRAFVEVFSPLNESDNIESMDIGTFLIEEVPTFIFYKILAKDYKRLLNSMTDNESEVKTVIKKLHSLDYDIDDPLEVIDFPLLRIQQMLDIIDVSLNMNLPRIFFKYHPIKNIKQYIMLK